MRHILLVEDNLGDARLAQEMLAESPDFEADVQCVGRLAQAVEVLGTQPIELVLLDLTLPDSHGLEGLKQLQSLAKDAPIIVLSGLSDKAVALEALKQGAQDYLIKGTTNAEGLTRVIQYSIERKAAEVRYRSLVANIPGVVYRCQSDLAWSMVYVSQAFDAVTGYAPEEFLTAMAGRYVDLIHPDDLPSITRMILGAVTRCQPYSVEYRVLRKNATIGWVLDRGQATGRSNGAMPSRDGVLFDITEQKQLEEQVRRAEHQIWRARQFAAMGNLAGGIAHDFNNLLTAINGFADLALTDVAEDSRAYANLGQIRRASMRAVTIAQQLLTLGQTSAREVTLVDLSLLVADMERLIRLVIGSHRRIEIVTDQLAGRVKANSGQLEQAILVLAMNLFAGRGAAAQLRIDVRSWEVSRDDAELLGFVFGGAYVAVVLRAGSPYGQAAEDAEAMQVVSPDGELVSDMGFGLARVLKIATEHQGHFLVSRNESGVQEYQIVLPCAQITSDTLAFSDPGRPLRRRGTETVLVVDNEESIRMLVRQLLEDQGYRVLEAAGGLQALDVSRQCGHPIDLLIADEVLPDLRGHELAERLCEERPGLSVLPMSTSQREPDSGKRPFLLKPFTAESLLRSVGETLADKRIDTMEHLKPR